jgi:hypothetical protein
MGGIVIIISNNSDVLPRIYPEYADQFLAIFGQPLARYMPRFMGIGTGFDILSFEARFCILDSDQSIHDQIVASHGENAATLIEVILSYDKWFSDIVPDNRHLEGAKKGKYYIQWNEYKTGDKQFVGIDGSIVYPFAYHKEDKKTYSVTHLPTGRHVFSFETKQEAQRMCEKFAIACPDYGAIRELIINCLKEA